MPKFQEGDRVLVHKRYAYCQGKEGTVISSWEDPNGNAWARIHFGQYLDGSPIRQVVPQNCLTEAPND